jgi:hypothetical protein
MIASLVIGSKTALSSSVPMIGRAAQTLNLTLGDNSLRLLAV